MLQGCVAIVTGAGRGIGKAIAAHLAAEGARVVVATRTPGQGEAVAAEIRESGGDAHFFEIDVTQRARIDELVGDTVGRYGDLDIIVHAAADIPYAKIDDLTDDGFDRCWTSVVKAAFWLMQKGAPHLAKHGHGRAVLISSTNGNGKINLGLAHCGAAKAALNAFGRGAAKEYASRGVTVNMVNPGLIASDRMREHVSPAHEAELVQKFPIARSGTPEEVAAAVMTFLGPGSDFVTGAELVVDGGALL